MPANFGLKKVQLGIKIQCALSVKDACNLHMKEKNKVARHAKNMKVNGEYMG